ncbi:hypothetical protein SanaruYs_34980 [Chryseotalea sanaruensis]|uniref:Uncharacterized protein n=1 Tax=Chryseotalea sanaruensis TaxID=2482724 RepID=A0A401UEB6_9BACT|nr:hypothetical protein SanaruYs_34980 [Chryseotalea sanaruensis]
MISKRNPITTKLNATIAPVLDRFSLISSLEDSSLSSMMFSQDHGVPEKSKENLKLTYEITTIEVSVAPNMKYGLLTKS